MSPSARTATILLGLILALQAVPVIAVLVNAFAGEWSSTILPQDYTTGWVTAMLADPRMVTAIGNAFFVAIAALVVSALLTVPAVLAGHFYWPTLDRALGALVVVPYAVPGIVLALGLLHLYSGNYGIVLNGSPLILILAYVPLGASFFYLPIKNNLAALPTAEIFEAGWLVGASDLTILRRIILPSLVPAIIVGSVMNFTLAMSEFVYANLLVGGAFPTLQTFLFMLRAGSGHSLSVVIIVYFVVVFASTGVMVLMLSRERMS